jgi:gliding motility-associated-like protein
MYKNIYIGFFLFLSSSVFAQDVYFDWAKQYVSPSYSVGQKIAKDPAGNLYTLGLYVGTVDFDPGPNVYNLTSTSGNNTYITKLDPLGNFIWAKSFRAYTYQLSDRYITNNLVVDSTGNIYCSGLFRNQVDFDPGVGVYNLNSAIFPKLTSYILKLNTNGNFVWANAYPGIFIQAITLHDKNNLFFSGNFEETVNFAAQPDSFNVTTMFYHESFICKYTTDNHFKWVKTYAGTGQANVNCLEVDTDGNIYSAGNFDKTIDFDPSIGTFNMTSSGLGTGTTNVFVSKWDSTGNFVWTKQFYGEKEIVNYDLEIDKLNDLIVTGKFSDLVTLGLVNDIISVGEADIYFVKMNSANGDIIWGKSIGGASYPEDAFSVKVDKYNNFYLCGKFATTMDFDPNAGVYNLICGSVNVGVNPFIAKYTASGNIVWAKALISNAAGLGTTNSMLITENETIYCTGSFAETMDFDPEIGTYNMTTPGFLQNTFILRLRQCPNKTFGTATIDACGTYTLNNYVYDSSGTFYQVLTNTQGCDSILTLNITIHKTDTSYTTISNCGPYTWNGQLYNNSGTYIKHLTTVYGCDSIAKLLLNVYPKTFSTITKAICQGQSYLGYTNTGVYVDTLLGANVHGCDSVRTLQLSVQNKVFTSLSQTLCEGTHYFGHTTAGVYIDSFLSAAGCDSIRTLQLTIIPKKITNLNQIICHGTTYFAGGTLQNSSGIYKDTFMSTQGCDSIVTTTLLVRNKISINLGADTSICKKDSLLLTPGLFTSYLWQDNSTTPNYIAKAAGLYWVKVTDNNNCMQKDTFIIKNVFLHPKDFLPADQNLCAGNKLLVTIPGYKKYAWSTGDSTISIDIRTFQLFTLAVTDANGCKGIDSLTITKINCIPLGIPSAFSPNGDGKNDVFLPGVFKELVEYRLSIYNRYGQRVFLSTNPLLGWDGTYKAIPQPLGTFIYKVYLKTRDGEPFSQSGTVVLVR